MENTKPTLAAAGSVDLATMLRPSGAILRAQIMLARALDVHAVSRSEHDATTIDLLTRIKLSTEGRLRAVDLCDQLQKSPSHVSRVIDRAEADGLVKRLPDPGDRRAHLVTLTDDGRSVVDELGPFVAYVLDQAIFSVLSEEEIDTLVSLLERVTHSSRRLIVE
jgi:DNA-binding MarR family transcriptional regulator